MFLIRTEKRARPKNQAPPGNDKAKAGPVSRLGSGRAIRCLRPLRDRRGSTMVEFGLVAPLALLLIFGIIEGGRVIWAYGLMSHAAREGTRYAMVHGSDADNVRTETTTAATVKSYVQGRAAPLSPIDVFTSWEDPGHKPGSVVEVRVEYNYEPLLALLLPLKPMTLSSTPREWWFPSRERPGQPRYGLWATGGNIGR